MEDSRPKAFTWRATEIPAGTTKKELVERYFTPKDRDRITVGSLCPDIDREEELVATMLFKPHPERPNDAPQLDYHTPVDLEIEKDFPGFTPLYCPPKGTHITADIVAITGLAGHAFGSWAHSEDRMWLRDYLPKFASSARILTYGYTTRILGENISAPLLADLGNSFIDALFIMREASKCDQRPIIFIGHSLGCLVIKKAMTSARYQLHVDSSRLPVRAIIFLAAPHRGMNVDALRTLVRDEPSEQLIDELKPGSSTLEEMNERFVSIANDIDILTCFETRKTRTIIEVSKGKWTRTGPEIMMVEPGSAKQYWSKEKVIHADADHSGIAKLKKSQGSIFQNIKATILRALASTVQISRAERFESAEQDELTTTTPQKSPSYMFGINKQYEDRQEQEQRGQRDPWSITGYAAEFGSPTRSPARSPMALSYNSKDPNVRTEQLCRTESGQIIHGDFDSPCESPADYVSLPAYSNEVYEPATGNYSAPPSGGQSPYSPGLLNRVSRQQLRNVQVAQKFSRVSQKFTRIGFGSRNRDQPLAQSSSSEHFNLPKIDTLEEDSRINRKDTDTSSSDSKLRSESEDIYVTSCSNCDANIESHEFFYQCSSCSVKDQICQGCQKTSKYCLKHQEPVMKHKFVLYGIRQASDVWVDPEPIEEDSILVRALKEQDMNLLDRLVEDERLINAFDDDGRTPLHIAASLDLRDGAKFLLMHGANTEALDRSSCTPLGQAILSKQYGMVKMLLENGVNPDSVESGGDTPLHLACTTGSIEMVEMLLKTVKSVDETNYAGETALFRSCKVGELDIAKLLIIAGAKPNTKTKDDETTLLGELAAQNKGIAVDFLLNHGATLEMVDSSSRTALYRAAANDHFELCRKLIHLGASPHTKTKDGDQTVLGQAAANGNTDTVKVLLEEGAEVEEKDSQLRTPLFRAAETGKLEVCRVLLDHDADPNPDKVCPLSPCWLMTALNISSYNGHASVAELLAEYGADLEDTDSHGFTSLYLAAEHGHLEVCKSLIALGANPNVLANNWDSALSVAARNGHLEVVKFLLAQEASAMPPPSVKGGKWKNFVFDSAVTLELCDKIRGLLRAYKHL